MNTVVSPPTISVALCTHNGARFVGEQVRSILEQTVPPNEIVLSDDASTDETVSIVRAEVAARPELGVSLVVLVNATALRVVKNFEQALLASSGELIALCDQDDRWHPEKLARIVEIFAQRPEISLVHTDARLISEDGSSLAHTLLESLEVTAVEKEEIHSGQGFEALLRRNLVTGATAVLRGSLLSHAAPFPSSWVHDEWLGIIAGATSRTELLEAELIDYRQHESNQIGARKLGLRDKIRKLREPRAERNAHLLVRAIDLVERVRALGDVVDPRYAVLAEKKLAHERYRSALPAARPLRLFPVLREAFRGQYSSYSRGSLDVLRDIVQPAR